MDTAGAVAVAAFTKDNKMILTKQYRHPLGKMIDDLPAGGITSEDMLEPQSDTEESTREPFHK